MKGKWEKTTEHFYSEDGAWGAENSVCGQMPRSKIEIQCPACVFALAEAGIEVPTQILPKEESRVLTAPVCEACVCEAKMRITNFDPILDYVLYELLKDRHICSNKKEVEDGKD